jgi:error-prone DNA polymerase
VGKALGFDLAVVDAIAKGQQWFDGRSIRQERFAELGLDAGLLAVQQLITLTEQLIVPRHLSQHTGGFVLTRAAVPHGACGERVHGRPHGHRVGQGRSGRAGLLKVDVLALGMLSAIRRALDFIGQRRGCAFTMQDIPPEDRPPTT